MMVFATNTKCPQDGIQSWNLVNHCKACYH